MLFANCVYVIIYVMCWAYRLYFQNELLLISDSIYRSNRISKRC